MVRSTASGQTCGIDPNGRILAMAEPFTEAQLTVQIPIVTLRTLYTEYGDYLPRFFLALTLFLLIAGQGRSIIRKVQNRREEP
jgi:apolipoprotein N-acyltransferase